MTKKIKTIDKPPDKWLTTCIETGKDMATADVDIGHMCTIMWNDKSDGEKAKIILEGKSYPMPRKTRDVEYTAEEQIEVEKI